MAQLKPPDNDGHWDSIDIFVFTNGQQYSPPRKYHLRADELHWWDNTLTYLAKSQFGNMYSAIQLYTLDGHQVEGPLELRNGMAYVAVEPHNVFIDSGYDKYLIKATRSWEKRQARKSNSIEVTPDAVHIMGEEYKTDANNSDLMSIKPPDENITLESVINPIAKTPDPTEVKEQAPKLAPTTKQVEKKRTSPTQRITTFKKVTNPTVTPLIKKFGLKTDSPPKKLTKLPIRTPTVQVQNLSAKPRMNTKTVFKAKETPAGTAKVEDINIRKSQSLTKVPSNNKSLLTDSTPMENVIGDKEIILVTNIYKNGESDTKSIKLDLKKEQVGVQCVPQIVTIDEEVQSVDQVMEKEAIPKEALKNDGNTPWSNAIVSSNPMNDNHIAFINKGDVVNLRLIIEVRNVDNRIIKCRSIQKLESITNVLRKESQCNTEDEILIQSKSFQSALDSDISVGGERVLLIQCDCREADTENDTSRNNTPSAYINDKRYIVLLPQDEDTVICKCDQDLKTNTSKDLTFEPKYRKSSIIHPIKMTYSDMSLERLATSKNTDVTTSRDIQVIMNKTLPKTEYGTNTEYEPSTEYGTNTEYTNDEKTNNYLVTEQKEVYTEDKWNPSLSCTRRASQVSIITEYTNRSSIKESKIHIDDFTQTDSCDMLLEARRHEDGHYTFHLPSLLMLKHYKL